MRETQTGTCSQRIFTNESGAHKPIADASIETSGAPNTLFFWFVPGVGTRDRLPRGFHANAWRKDLLRAT